MTRDEIIDLACEHTVGGLEFDEEGLLRFVEIIAAAEREACAKLAVEESEAWHICSQSHDTANMIAAAIRARGQE